MKKFTILLSLSIILIGCATSQRINDVRIGMSRQEVVSLMGNPNSSSASDSAEYLNYNLSHYEKDRLIAGKYYVRLINGKVESFGRLGDFDSTKDPTIKIQTEDLTESSQETGNKEKLYTELKKLNQLKEEGIISEEEFQKEKEELLEKY